MSSSSSDEEAIPPTKAKKSKQEHEPELSSDSSGCSENDTALGSSSDLREEEVPIKKKRIKSMHKSVKSKVKKLKSEKDTGIHKGINHKMQESDNEGHESKEQKFATDQKDLVQHVASVNAVVPPSESKVSLNMDQMMKISTEKMITLWKSDFTSLMDFVW